MVGNEVFFIFISNLTLSPLLPQMLCERVDRIYREALALIKDEERSKRLRDGGGGGGGGGGNVAIKLGIKKSRKNFLLLPFLFCFVTNVRFLPFVCSRYSD